MRMTSFVLQPGADREGCEYAVAPNRRPMDVAGFALNVTPGTHHFVLWEYLGKDQSSTDFWTGIQYAPGCTGLGPRDSFVSNANLFGTVSAATKRIRFPPGVAVRLEPHAIVYPNLHFHNYSAAPIAAQAVFNLIPARPGSVKHHAQAFTIGSRDISIPARGTASLTGEWQAVDIVDERDLADAGERLSAFLTGAASALPTVVPLTAARAARANNGHGQKTDNRSDSAVAPVVQVAVSS